MHSSIAVLFIAAVFVASANSASLGKLLEVVLQLQARKPQCEYKTVIPRCISSSQLQLPQRPYDGSNEWNCELVGMNTKQVLEAFNTCFEAGCTGISVETPICPGRRSFANADDKAETLKGLLLKLLSED